MTKLLALFHQSDSVVRGWLERNAVLGRIRAVLGIRSATSGKDNGRPANGRWFNIAYHQSLEDIFFGSPPPLHPPPHTQLSFPLSNITYVGPSCICNCFPYKRFSFFSFDLTVLVFNWGGGREKEREGREWECVCVWSVCVDVGTADSRIGVKANSTNTRDVWKQPEGWVQYKVSYILSAHECILVSQKAA